MNCNDDHHNMRCSRSTIDKKKLPAADRRLWGAEALDDRAARGMVQLSSYLDAFLINCLISSVIRCRFEQSLDQGDGASRCHRTRAGRAVVPCRAGFVPQMISICKDPQIRQEDPENHFSAVAGGAYDLSVVTGMPAWREVQLLVARELGEPVYDARPLTPVRRSRMTWAARAQGTGAIVVKVRHGDRADEKTRWCAAHLPALGARGYPVPAILWHGMISAQWHVTVQNRLPGRPLYALDGPLDGPMLDAAAAPGRVAGRRRDPGRGPRFHRLRGERAVRRLGRGVGRCAPGLRGGRSAVRAAAALASAGLGAAAAASRLRPQRPESVERPDRRGTDHRRGGLG